MNTLENLNSTEQSVKNSTKRVWAMPTVEIIDASYIEGGANPKAHEGSSGPGYVS